MTEQSKRATPMVKGDILLYESSSMAEQRTVSVRLKVGSAQWLQWLRGADRFYVAGTLGKFTARREIRRNQAYWYACRKLGGKLYKKYIGKSEDITPDVLRDVDLALSAMIKEDAASV